MAETGKADEPRHRVAQWYGWQTGLVIFLWTGVLLLVGAGVGLTVNQITSRLQSEFRVPGWSQLAMTLVALISLGAYVTIAIDNASTPLASTPDDEAITSLPGAGGWGPGRETYTKENPPAKPVLNSITDNPTAGDERNFVQVRNATRSSKYAEDIQACSGDTVEVYVGVWNDAASQLGEDGTIRGLRMHALASDQIERTSIGMVLSSTNAGSVWDSATLSCAGRPVSLEYLEGASRIFFSKDIGGRILEADPFRDPVPLGRDAPDGRFPATGVWGGYLVLQLTVL